jgi:hypothetical protein
MVSEQEIVVLAHSEGWDLTKDLSLTYLGIFKHFELKFCEIWVKIASKNHPENLHYGPKSQIFHMSFFIWAGLL